MKDVPAAVAGAPNVAATNAFADYLALTKPRLNFLVVASSAAGYYLGAPGSPDLIAMAQAVAGTALVAGGAAALNQVAERDTDAMMRRTRLRPLPDGRVPAADARAFGIALSVAGLAVLAVRASWLSASLALATLIGAVPGALPPVIGWTASHGAVAPGGAALFAIVFLWQIPHFMAIAWMYRDDYGKAGFPMLSVVDPVGRRASREALFYAAVLLPVSLLPTMVRLTGMAYLAVAVVLGIALLWLAFRFAVARSDASARALFFGSITYLPLLWIAMIVNKL